jgi:hypothetical protein
VQNSICYISLMDKPSTCWVKIELAQLAVAAVTRAFKASKAREAAKKLNGLLDAFDLEFAEARVAEHAAANALNQHRTKHGC